ncbi:DUF1609 domain-containing protein [Cardinium endosymbiont of Sogatella furcifera]|uniref:DUF1609 domain-containing protein n=1 Tax=Cardinium endosymbiont of Sogatella furcifera TaxID=650378 RepID=UPI0013B46D28|nr:DUF1609 domain-containing protein [Cardinium endosymbiont of Sogatella furcifera]
MILLLSCVTNHLRIPNRAQQIAEKHTKIVMESFTVLQPPCGGQGAKSIGTADAKQTIKIMKEYCGMNNEKYNIVEPFYCMNRDGQSDSITPLTRLNDYENNKKGTLLTFINSLVITNGHLLMNLELLSIYLGDESKIQEESVRKAFIKIEQVALESQRRYRAGAMFADVTYKAIEDIITYVRSRTRMFSQAHQLHDNFHATVSGLYSHILTNRKSFVDVLKIVFERYKEAELAVTHAQHIYKKRLQALNIENKIIDLYRTKGKDEAARFYLDVLAILEETETEAKAKEKINEAFTNAQETPLKTVDQLVLEIEPSPRSNPNLGLHRKKHPKTKQQKLKTKNLKNFSAQESDKVNQPKKSMPFIWEQNEAELQEANKLLQSVGGLQKRFDTYGYKVHPRVLRWVGATTDQIKKFDMDNKNKKIHYTDLREEDILLQKAYHDLKGVELLLCVDDHKDYFFNTPKGKSAFTILKMGDVTVEGILEMGISDEGNIYHMMFNDKVKHRPEQLFQITDPLLEDADEGGLDSNANASQWCNKDGFEIAKQDDTYIVSFGMPTSTHCSMPQPSKKLFIQPNKLSIKSIKNLAN